MAEEDSIEDFVSARIFLKTSLENSRALAFALDNTGQRLKEINQRLPSLKTAVRFICTPKCSFVAIRDHVDRAIGPTLAVLKVYDAIQELEKSLLSQPCSDLFTYLSLVKRLEEALKFLSDNCGLAIQWLEGILQFLDDNVISNELYVFNVNESLKILQELQMTEQRACLNGGLLFAAFDNLEIQFKQLLTENCIPVTLAFFSSSMGKQVCIAPSALPVAVIQKLQAIISRLNAVSRLEKCLSTYVEVRSMNARRSLQALDLTYLEESITDSVNVQDIVGFMDQWCKHLELAMKHIFEPEYNLCNDVFDKVGSDVCMHCFVNIATQSGILSFLNFGKKVTECKKDPIKLLKLLEIFASLDNLRVDFNRLFGGEACLEIQTLTRDLIKRVVNGACEIFWELPFQVKLQKQSFPPSDGSVPRLVSFVTEYCNHLLGDDYRPLLTQVLRIHQSWKHEKYQEGLIISQIYLVIKEIGLNLDAWSKAHKDMALSYLFMMNNHCHFCNLKGTKLGDLMGDSWLRAHEQYKDYYMALYLRESWGKILGLLNREGQILSSPSRVSNGDLVKKRLKAFNEAFDDMYEKQSRWVVPNENVRLKMCKLVVQAFVPVYRSYLQNHGLLAEYNASPTKCVRYTAQDLETMLSSLFQPKVRRFHSTKHFHFIGKIKNIVTDHFYLILLAV